MEICECPATVVIRVWFYRTMILYIPGTLHGIKHVNILDTSRIAATIILLFTATKTDIFVSISVGFSPPSCLNGTNSNKVMSATPNVLVIREAEVLERQATHLVGTLGHVSEGKSTLIRALTGVKTQRHAAEQERNITIHLGYANCKVYQNRVTGELKAGAMPPSGEWSLVAHLSFVDCPGHEAYLATMLGGASVMDSACLIIAANQDQIPQPQTLEHLIAAELMGLDRIAIVQNKLDLVDEAAANANYAKIRALVDDKPIFPAAAQHGWGVSRVLDYVTRALPPPNRNLNAPALLTCVRSFDVNKPTVVGPATSLVGAVIGGTLQQGVLAVGDWLEVRPGILRRGPAGELVAQPVLSRVRGLRCDATDLPYAIPGSLIAIATDLDPGLSIANGMVGQRVGVPGTLPPIAGELSLRLYRLKRDNHSFGKHKVGDRVRVCSNVMTVEGKVTAIADSKHLTVTLSRPLCVGIGERVGLLRHHPDAGRELIEGAAAVRDLVPWDHVREPDGADLVTAPSRTVIWEPLTHDTFAPAPLDYGTMLADVMGMRPTATNSGSSSFHLPDIVVSRIPKHTIWGNWGEVTALLDLGGFGTLPYRDHLLDYVQADLSTTGNLNGMGQLVLAGKWRAEDLRALLRKYVGTFKRCAQCHQTDTGLVRDGRVIKVRCSRCMTDSVTS